MGEMAQQRQNEHIETFFRRERQKLVGHARTLVADATERDAEDIVQDVMLGLFDRGESCTPLEDLAAYVYGSIRNRVVNIWRKRRVPTVSLDAPLAGGGRLEDVLADARQNLGHVVEQAELLAAFEVEFGRLSVAERVLITATDFEGHTFREVASAWGEPIGTLLARKKRALDKLRLALSGHFPEKEHQNSGGMS